MNELLKVNYDSEQPTVSGRELHDFLAIKTRYSDWFHRMIAYGFEEGSDYATVLKNVYRADGAQMPQSQQDHELTIPMAKELCMLQRNEKGKQARQYFLKVEEAWNSPEMIMERALKLSNARVRELLGSVSELKVENQIMKPKADYFDELVERNLLTNFRDTAKQLGIKQRDFVNFLLEKKYLYRDKSGKLLPYADKNNGLFELKECFNEATNWAGTQTLITPKGRETFRLLCI